jgi:hypothetical protein
MSGFDTRIAVEERYNERYEPDLTVYHAVNRSVFLFGVLVVLGFINAAVLIAAGVYYSFQ